MHLDSTFWNVEDGIIGPLPGFWCGVDTPDGTAYPWLRAPVGATYVYLDRTNGVQRRFVKQKADGRTDDWVSGLSCITKRVSYTDFTDGGGASGTYTLGEQVPQGAWVLQTVLENVTGFTGDTSAVIIVGDGTDTDRYNTGTPSVFTTANAIDLGVPSGTKIHTAAKSVTITITSAADWGAVTAGALTIRLYYLQ